MSLTTVPDAASVSQHRTPTIPTNAPSPAAAGGTSVHQDSVTSGMMKLPSLDERVVEALHEIVRKSLDRFTGSVVLNFQGGVTLDIQTRTKRRLPKS